MPTQFTVAGHNFPRKIQLQLLPNLDSYNSLEERIHSTNQGVFLTAKAIKLV